MFIGLYGIIDQELHNSLRALQRSIVKSDGYGVMPSHTLSPHISLLSSFKIDDHQCEDIVAYFTNILSHKEPITIECCGLNNFGESILFCDMIQSLELKKLHVQMVEELQQKYQRVPLPFDGFDRFHFHITICGGNEPLQKSDKLIKEYDLQDFHKNFQISEYAITLNLHETSQGWFVFKLISGKKRGF